MKNRIKTTLMIIFLFLISFQKVKAQHVPPCNGFDHDTSICRGYAVARAYGHGWYHSDCPASTLFYDYIPPGYFDRHNGLTLTQILAAVQVNDIIIWGINGFDHAAYVKNFYGGSPELIMIDEVREEGG